MSPCVPLDVSGMSPVVLIVALAFGLVATAHYARALQQAAPYRLSQTGHANRLGALNIVAWVKSLPAPARRDYALSTAYSAVFIACIAVLAYREGSRVVMVVFAGLAALALAMTALRRMRLRPLR